MGGGLLDKIRKFETLFGQILYELERTNVPQKYQKLKLSKNCLEVLKLFGPVLDQNLLAEFFFVGAS